MSIGWVSMGETSARPKAGPGPRQKNVRQERIAYSLALA